MAATAWQRLSKRMDFILNSIQKLDDDKQSMIQIHKDGVAEAEAELERAKQKLDKAKDIEFARIERERSYLETAQKDEMQTYMRNMDEGFRGEKMDVDAPDLGESVSAQQEATRLPSPSKILDENKADTPAADTPEADLNAQGSEPQQVNGAKTPEAELNAQGLEPQRANGAKPPEIESDAQGPKSPPPAYAATDGITGGTRVGRSTSPLSPINNGIIRTPPPSPLFSQMDEEEDSDEEYAPSKKERKRQRLSSTSTSKVAEPRTSTRKAAGPSESTPSKPLARPKRIGDSSYERLTGQLIPYAMISRSHPTVIRSPNNDYWVELRCSHCRSNAKANKSLFMCGQHGMCTHMKVSHDDKKPKGGKHHIRTVVEDCTFHILTDEEADAILKGVEGAYPIPLIHGENKKKGKALPAQGADTITVTSGRKSDDEAASPSRSAVDLLAQRLSTTPGGQPEPEFTTTGSQQQSPSDHPTDRNDPAPTGAPRKTARKSGLSGGPSRKSTPASATSRKDTPGPGTASLGSPTKSGAVQNGIPTPGSVARNSPSSPESVPARKKTPQLLGPRKSAPSLPPTPMMGTGGKRSADEAEMDNEDD